MRPAWSLVKEKHMECDLLIRNGSIMDGSGSQAFEGDVAVRNGRIAAIGRLPEATAAHTTDAKGLVVSPGFIDPHTHADFIFAWPEHHGVMESFVRQGITTMVTGNCGASPAPMNPDYLDQIATYWDCILPRSGLPWNWRTMREYLDHLETIRPALNIAQLVGHGTVRVNVMGYAPRRATPSETGAMREQVRQSLEDGALGLSYGLGYVPGVWARTDELIEVARDLPGFGGHITVHLRGQTEFFERAVEEMIRVAETVGAPLQLSHFVPFAADYTEQFFNAYEATERARKRGVEIGYDLLPYAVSSTTLLSLYPPWMFEDGLPAFFERLKNPKVRERLLHEFKTRGPEWPTWKTGTWPDHRYDKEAGWSRHRLHGFRKPENRKYEGVNLEAIAEDMGKDPFEALFELTLVENGRLYYTAGFHDDDGFDMAMGVFLRLPNMSCMTDSVGIGHRAPHPSIYGAFPRFLGRHGRDWATFSLEEAVRKCTSLPARQLGLPDRGVLREGAFADIVIFDRDKINDKAAFARPFLYPEGIETVIINGAPVWFDGQYRADSPAGHVITRN